MGGLCCISTLLVILCFVMLERISSTSVTKGRKSSQDTTTTSLNRKTGFINRLTSYRCSSTQRPPTTTAVQITTTSTSPSYRQPANLLAVMSPTLLMLVIVIYALCGDAISCQRTWQISEPISYEFDQLRSQCYRLQLPATVSEDYVINSTSTDYTNTNM